MTIADRSASGSAVSTYIRYGEIYLHTGQDITTGFPYFTQAITKSKVQLLATPYLHLYMPTSSSFDGYFDSWYTNFRKPVMMSPLSTATPLEEQILSKVDNRVVVGLRKYLHLTPAQGTIRTNPVTSRIALS